jgi:PilZ domain
MEQRKEKRFSKRLYVVLRLESIMVRGLSNDFSGNGLFIKCNHDFPVGAVIDIEIFMPDNINSFLKGIVRRKIDIPASYRKYGLGIELIKKDVRYKTFVASSLAEVESQPFTNNGLVLVQR